MSGPTESRACPIRLTALAVPPTSCDVRLRVEPVIDIGIGLPTRLAASHPDVMFEWMKRADEASFSSLAVTDRVVTDALEPLVVLAAAAGATRRIRLLASVIIGPTRETTLLARQTASIDALSGGRLTLGLGVGARQEDYVATGSSFGTRERRFDLVGLSKGSSGVCRC